jgi:hypothetical protein
MELRNGGGSTFRISTSIETGDKRMTIRYSVILCSLCVALLAGCSLFSPTPDALSSRPDDFRIVYEWQEGSLPPPYHYAYTISIEPDGHGQIVMIPDYPSENVPTWTETFQVSQAGLDSLYHVMVGQGLFTQDWRAEDSPPVGGSSQYMVVTAHQKTITLPSYLAPAQDSSAEEMFSAVNAALPQAVWDKLNAQREEYVQEHER